MKKEYTFSIFPLLFLIQLLISLNLSAQSDGGKISGIVKSENGEVLRNMKVSDTISKTSTVSNSSGFFSLQLKQKESVLCIEGVGYETFFKTINTIQTQEPLVIVMKEKNLQLQTIEIHASQTELAYKNPSSYIMDYVFYNDDILLLLEENGKKYLRLIDPHEQTLAEIRTDHTAQALFTDCLNNTQLLLPDSAFQVVLSDQQLKLVSAVSTHEFNTLLAPCKGYIRNNFYFAMLQEYKQSILYFTANKTSPKKKIFYSVSNKSAARYVQQFACKNAGNQEMAAHAMGDNDFTQQEFLRMTESDKAFLDRVLLNPVYSPLFVLKDSVFIFDHIRDSAFVFSAEGNFCRAFSLWPSANASGKNQLICDYSKPDVFLTERKNPLASYSRINLDNGKKEATKILTGYPFPEKIKIRNGRLYFIFRNKEGGNSNYLYCKKID